MKRWGVVAVSLVLMLLLACGRRGVAPEVVPSEFPNYRADAVVGFGEGIDNEILYALREPRRFDWSFAPAMRIPATGNTAMTAAGSADSAGWPLLVVLRAHVDDRPYVNVRLLQVGSAAPDSTVETDVVARPCVGESWLAAFFIEGLGPRPPRPVVIRYTTEGSTYRLRVDPRLHTLRATPALRLTRWDVDADSSLPQRRVVSFQPAKTLQPVMPLIVWRDERRWWAAGGTGRNGYYGVIMNEYRDQGQPEEWRFYMLEAPPPC